MALRGTLTHWKTRLLAQKLGVQPWAALGLLEALWHVTAELAPAGNIGRLPNEAIAMEMFYEGDPNALVEALLFSKHLEPHDLHRLIIHDWSQHSDYNTRRKVTRRGESMADGSAPRLVMTRHKSIPEPVPEPVPEPEPEPEPVPEPVKKKPSRGKREAHVLFAPMKEMIFKYFRGKNSGVDPPWDGMEAKNLSALLASSPAAPLEHWHTCLVNRYKSDVAHGDRPGLWLSRLSSYQSGPLNEYNRPKGENNGTNKPKWDQQAEFDKAFAEIDKRYTATGADARVGGVLPGPKTQ